MVEVMVAADIIYDPGTVPHMNWHTESNWEVRKS